MRTFLAATVLGAVLAGSLAVAQDKPDKLEPIIRENPGSEMRLELRRLWSRHLAATRHWVVSSMSGLPDAGQVHRNLLKQNEDLTEFFRPHLGDEAADRLAERLQEHAQILGDVLRASRGTREDFAGQRRRWEANGREIAGVLASANPEWNRGRLEEMVLKLLGGTAAEIESRQKKDWVADLGAHEAAHEHLLRFADVLTLGLARLDPERFHDLP